VRQRAKGAFLQLKGYIDESYNTRMFTLSAVLGTGLNWAYFESAWKKRVAAKNKELKVSGRPKISRVHASDLSNRKGEFEGWTTEEQIAFTQDLIGVFGKAHYLFITAYSMPLDLFVAEFPESRNKVLPSCYAILLKFLMFETGDMYERAKARGDVRPVNIALIHDRSSYDAVLLDTFNKMLDDKGFEGRKYFSSITPLAWDQCIPLQAADFLAYENMKDSDRLATGSPRTKRKSLAALLDLSSLGGATRRFDAKTLRDMREFVERERKKRLGAP
jgi:hypothetical protein